MLEEKTMLDYTNLFSPNQSVVGKIKDTIEVLICKASIDSYISCDKFVLVNNVLKEYNEIKEKIKNPETSVEYIVKNSGKLLCQQLQ